MKEYEVTGTTLKNFLIIDSRLAGILSQLDSYGVTVNPIKGEPFSELIKTHLKWTGAGLHPFVNQYIKMTQTFTEMVKTPAEVGITKEGGDEWGYDDDNKFRLDCRKFSKLAGLVWISTKYFNPSIGCIGIDWVGNNKPFKEGIFFFNRELDRKTSIQAAVGCSAFYQVVNKTKAFIHLVVDGHDLHGNPDYCYGTYTDTVQVVLNGLWNWTLMWTKK